MDDTSTVVWLQLESRMADVRIPASHTALSGRGALAECSLDELRQLAASESSCSITTCSPVAIGPDGIRRATAEWPGSDDEIAFQPVSAFPEPGLLEWSDDASVMIERAPSGAYVEEWVRLDDTQTLHAHRLLDDRRQLFVTGAVAVLVRDRPAPIERMERLDVLVAQAGDDRAALEALVDCEFSVAERRGSRYVVTASTFPWRIGDELDVAV